MLRFYFNVWSGEGVFGEDCIFKIEYLHALSISDYKDILHLCAHKYTHSHTRTGELSMCAWACRVVICMRSMRLCYLHCSKPC